MKYLFINTVAGNTSTGTITANLCRKLTREGNECVLAYGRWKVNCDDVKTYRIGTDLDYKVHGLMTRFFDLQGFCSTAATKKFVSWIKEYDPDVIWLHNLHGYYINVEILFEYLKSCKKEIRWTLHDCWAFTGHCTYFTMVKCDQWKQHCRKCPQLREYPACYVFSNVSRNFDRKKKAFTGVENLTLITPSQWLADLTRESFLKCYPVKVIHNTIDKNIFKPIESDFRRKNGIEDKIMLLGVANGMDKWKGLPDFIKLSKMLNDQYVIVLVGVKEKDIDSLPDNVIGLAKTNNQKELAGIYSTADLFLNLTHQDNYPTVNLEAQACGTPVVTYRVGGSPESVPDENVVEERDFKGLMERINNLNSLKYMGGGTAHKHIDVFFAQDFQWIGGLAA